MAADVLPQIPPPADSTEVLDWSQFGPELLKRPFVGTCREAVGFRVRVEGVQRENGSCARRIVVVPPAFQTPLEPEAVRELASVLSAAVDEIEARR